MFPKISGIAEFYPLLQKSIKGKQNIGIADSTSKGWDSIGNVPKAIGDQIDSIMSILQTAIDNGFICDKEKQCIIVTEFQPVCMGNGYDLYMAIKPIGELNDKHVKFESDLPGIIVYPNKDGKTISLINSTQWMLNEKQITKEEAAEDKDLEPAMSYGSFPKTGTSYLDKAQITQATLLALSATSLLKVVVDTAEGESKVSTGADKSKRSPSDLLRQLQINHKLPTSPSPQLLRRTLTVNTALPTSGSAPATPGSTVSV